MNQDLMLDRKILANTILWAITYLGYRKHRCASVFQINVMP